jgi:hypothetical protein
MTACGLFEGPPPRGFRRRVVRLEPGCELAFDRDQWVDAIVLVERGEIELECPAGVCRRYGCGAMIPIALLPLHVLRNAGAGPLVLVAVSRDR